MSFRAIQIPPDEGVSLVKFSACSDSLFTLTWRGTLRVYDAAQLAQIHEYDYGSPLISGCWAGAELIACGSIDGRMFLTDGSAVDAHSDAISSIAHVSSRNQLITSSWDATVKVWDMGDLREPVHVFSFNQKIMFMGVNGTRIVCCGNRNYVFVVDMDDPSRVERRTASLGKQLRSFGMCGDGLKWAIGSIDGRIALEYFGDLRHQAQRFSFNCNKHESDEDRIVVYPVNSLAFHPVTGILASADSYGRIFFWDIENKRKLSEIYATHDNSVSSIDFSSDGSLLAISYSYMFDKGPIDDNPQQDVLLLYNPPQQFITPIHNQNEETN